MWTTSYSQVNDSVYIVKIVDEMDDKSFLVPSRRMVISNKGMTQGFSLEGDIQMYSGKPKISGLSSVLIGIGSCQENTEMVLMFEDSTKLKFKSWNKFNCKGNAWYDLNDTEAQILATKKIIKAKVRNGVSFESFFSEVTEDQDYFIKLFDSAKNNNVKRRTK